MTQFISLVEFNWLSALSRFSVNLLFIGIMILLTARHISLRRFSFTFLMISLIVYFLCYTLKNFDLNLGMALGLFAIFGIIRYRTEPLQTEEMTYLFVTIGMAVINALSDEFLNLLELSLLNALVLASIIFGEFFLTRLAYHNKNHPLEENDYRKISLHLPYQEKNLHEKIALEIKQQSVNLGIEIKNHKIIKIDQALNIVVVHLYY